MKDNTRESQDECTTVSTQSQVLPPVIVVSTQPQVLPPVVDVSVFHMQGELDIPFDVIMPPKRVPNKLLQKGDVGALAMLESKLDTALKSDINPERFAIERDMGQGILVALDKETMQTVCIKIIRPSYQHECEILGKLSHEHIIPLLGVVQDMTFHQIPGRIGIVLPFLSGGELHQFMESAVSSHAFPIDEKLMRTWFHQICNGLDYMHRQGVVHLDIKTENIMFDENKCAVIIDTGLSLESPSLMVKASGEYGTPNWQAPEIVGRFDATKCEFSGCKTDFDGRKADLYSLGIVLFVMLTGKMPYRNADPTKRDDMWYYNQLVQGNVERFWRAHERFNYVSAPARALISGMINHDVVKRYTMAQIVTSEWYVGPVYEKHELSGVTSSVLGASV